MPRSMMSGPSLSRRRDGVEAISLDEATLEPGFDTALGPKFSGELLRCGPEEEGFRDEIV